MKISVQGICKIYFIWYRYYGFKVFSLLIIALLTFALTCSDKKNVNHTDHEINLLSHFVDYQNFPGAKTMLINQDHQVEMICNPLTIPHTLIFIVQSKVRAFKDYLRPSSLQIKTYQPLLSTQMIKSDIGKIFIAVLCSSIIKSSPGWLDPIRFIHLGRSVMKLSGWVSVGIVSIIRIHTLTNFR